jgi:hypothetical protein
MNGDMPRHLMNGAYFYDLIGDGLPSDLHQYTLEYFAQYPALSLGHHPLLLPLAEAPAYALFGISIASGRMVTIAFFLVGVIAWFYLVLMAYDEKVAFLATLIYVSSPIVVRFSQIVMSEMPAISLILVSAYLFYKYTETERVWLLSAFVACFAMACYAKQLSIFAIPAFVCYLALRRGLRSVFSSRVIIAFASLGILLVPLVLITLRYSPSNVAWVAAGGSTRSDWLTHFWFPIQSLWTHHFAWPIVVLAAIGLAGILVRRQKAAGFFLLWALALYCLVVIVKLHQPRIAMYWIPPFCLFAALSPKAFKSQLLQRAALVALVLAIGVQFAMAFTADLETAGGYEEAATYVVEYPMGTTVMYSSNVDTGYFVFFVRKLDPDRGLIVLRANKMLATSMMSRITEERIEDEEEIYALLDEMGTCYVVMENTPTMSDSIRLLAQAVQGENFSLRKEVPITSGDLRLQDVTISIYEYKRCGPANPDAMLNMNIPLVNESIHVRLGDVIERRAPE